MNIYKKLNELIEYIEENLEKEIDYNKMAQIIGTNENTLKRLFPFLADITISEYIRNRRLSKSGFDLYQNNEKVIDVAIKYGYDNSTAFSRAFEKFHGIKPSQVKSNPEKLKLFTKLQFNENINENENIEYSIVEMNEIILYAKGFKTTYNTIRKEAPIFFKEMLEIYKERYGEFNYGIVKYEDRFESDNFEYFVAYDKPVEGFSKIIIPKTKWMKFTVNSQNPIDIQKMSTAFYERFIPSLKINIKPIPELEYYHDNITDFLVPIED